MVIFIGNLIDLTGQRFNRLTVIKRAKNQNGKTMWLCKCDCGTEKVVRADSLKDGSIQSCGCLSKEITSQLNFKDLTGKRFGRWTVLHRVPNQNNCTTWRCRCDCGTERDVFANSLLNGTSKSCGCYKDQRAHDLNFIDLTGQRFGMLTVIERVDDYVSPSGAKSPRWRCICDCGNEKIVLSQHLRAGGVVSCGCTSGSHGEKIVSEILKQNGIDYIPQHKFEDCRDTLMLPFDFYLPDYNFCIEYDGQQHFEPINYFGGKKTFEKLKRHDQMKNDYCKDNNIGLLRLPYYLSNSELKEQILNTLKL